MKNSILLLKLLNIEKIKKQFDDITKGKKITGSNKNDAVKIDLALIDNHYILNEEVEGINKYALEHFTEIKNAYPNKPDDWILKVCKKKGK